MTSTAPAVLAPAAASDSGSPVEGVLRIARYSVYPRAERNHDVHVGYTRDLPSGTGFVFITPTPEAVGELLRVRSQELGGREAHDTLARVVSCQRVSESRFELRLEGLEAHAPRTVRARATS